MTELQEQGELTVQAEQHKAIRRKENVQECRWISLCGTTESQLGNIFKDSLQAAIHQAAETEHADDTAVGGSTVAGGEQPEDSEELDVTFFG